MKVNELRIGNWVKGLATGNYIQVDLFFLAELYNDRESGDDSTLDWYKAIPLTTEILEKAGFIRSKYDKYSNGRLGSVDIIYEDKGDYYEAYIDDEAGYRISCPIKSIHQLQNLYFALTGEELEINL